MVEVKIPIHIDDLIDWLEQQPQNAAIITGNTARTRMPILQQWVNETLFIKATEVYSDAICSTEELIYGDSGRSYGRRWWALMLDRRYVDGKTQDQWSKFFTLYTNRLHANPTVAGLLALARKASQPD